MNTQPNTQPQPLTIKTFKVDDFTYDLNEGWIIDQTNMRATGTEQNLLNHILKQNTIIYNIAEELRTIRMYTHLSTEEIIEEFTDQAHTTPQQDNPQ